MLQQWRAVGNIVSNLTGPRLELQISSCRDERVTAEPTGRCLTILFPKEIKDAPLRLKSIFDYKCCQANGFYLERDYFTGTQTQILT